MKKYVPLLIILIFFASCEKDGIPLDPKICADEYFYYSGGSEIYIKHSLDEVWIDFEQSDVTVEMAESVLGKYPFINIDDFEAPSYGKLRATISGKPNCSGFKDHLVELNQDDEIYSATPVFYTSEYHPDAYMILLSQVLTGNNTEVISEAEFIEYAETFGLELIKKKYSNQQFKVKEVETGFEALEIANEIYESEKSDFSHPNFISKIVLH